jgi:uncharacterized membrane protein YhiD involved in acid resistance
MTRVMARIASLVLVVLLASVAGAAAQAPPPVPQGNNLPELLEDTPNTDSQIERLTEAAGRLPIAAGLAALLALRPRRRGTPPRQPSVIQTQIILAVIGALVMLVVGSSLARAFGIVGAAGLVRYRAKVDNTKDAGVMLSTLTIGLAAGVGLWLLAIFGTLFIIVVLWAVESFEPSPTRLFLLRVKTKDPTNLKGRIEQLLRRHHATYEVRTVAQDELQFEVNWPFERQTDRVSEAILSLDAKDETEVEWEEKSNKSKK